MRILLIEDDDIKAKQIIQHINQQERHDLSYERSYQSGLRQVMMCDFELLLLDMSLPTWEKSPQSTGGRYRKFAGKEILNEMSRKSKIVPSIVVTQFGTFPGDVEGKVITLEELDSELRDKYPHLYVGNVFYNASVSEWKETLDNLVASVERKRT